MAGEILSNGAVHKHGATSEALTKMCPIKDIPEMFGAPELVEVTDLDDEMKRYIFGVAENGLKEFTANYVKATYTAIKETERTAGYYELDLDDGTKLTWQGQHVVGFPGAGSNGVLEMKIYIAPSTEITVA
jgi:hypothetical protein